MAAAGHQGQGRISTREEGAPSPLVETRDDLVRWIAAGEKPPSDWRIGTEHEKIPFYKDTLGHREGDFPITEAVARSTLALPFYSNLEPEKIEYVCHNLEQVIG